MQELPSSRRDRSFLFGLVTSPYWPSEEGLGKYPDTFVFVEPRGGDLIVSYPTNLGHPDAPTSEKHTTFRVILPVHVRPRIRVKVEHIDSSHYEYDYRLSNAFEASATITRWLWDRDVSDTNSLNLPTLWRVAHSQRAQQSYDTQGTIFEWTGSTDPLDPTDLLSKLIPGATIPDIRIISSNRPGFVHTYFQGGNVERDYKGRLPQMVEEQLDDALTLDRVGYRAIVLGPKYSPSSSEADIRSGLLADITLLESYNLLAPQSPFVKDVKIFLQQPAAAKTSSSRVRQGSLARRNPTGAIEQQLEWAIEAGLGFTGSYGTSPTSIATTKKSR